MELKNYFSQDEHGDILPDATCYLYLRGTESLAVGLQSATGLAIANPFAANDVGRVEFAAPNGLYDLRVVKGGRDYRLPVQCLDVLEQVAAAEAAANKSQQASDTALLSTGIYQTTAAGLLATASGKYFSVPSPESLEYLILYQKVGNVAVEVKRYPSSGVAALARRSNYLLSGRATKVEKVAETSDYQLSWARLYIFVGAGKAQAFVQAVTDLVVPNGKCAYVDLAEPQVGGEYLVHVSELPLATATPGAYIDDSKIILFTCLNNVIGGALYPQYQSVADSAVARAALAPSMQNVTDRAGWHVVGRATKLRPLAATPTTFAITFPELIISGGVTFASKKVAPVTNMNVVRGEALYVDLDSPLNTSGQLVPKVTTGGYTTDMLTSGSFLTDRKVFLFINGASGMGGPLAQPLVTTEFVDEVLEMRTKRPSLQVIGDLSRFVVSGTTCVMSFPDLRVARGVGTSTLLVAGMTDVSIPRGQALYVDLSAGLVDGKLVAQLTTGGYTNAAGGLVSGAFVDDQKLYLFINDVSGYGGVLSTRKPVNTYLGEVWMKQTPTNLTFDPATRTLAWDNYLFLPTSGGQERIKLAPGSFTFSNSNLNVAYLDLTAALTSGDTPATAIKGGTYFDTTVADRFRGQAHQVPIFYWNGATDYGPLCGFPRVKDLAAVTVSTLTQDDVVVKVGVSLISIFIKGAKYSSKKYLEFTLGYENKPFDPTGADAYGNSDLWRLKHAYEADLDPATISFVRSRSGKSLLNGGEITCAIKEKDAPDYIGGFHGDEIKSTAVLLLDGVEIPMGTAATYVGKNLQYVQRSTLFKCNTQTAVATRSQSLVLSHENGHAKIDMSQQVVWSQVLELEVAMLTMLPIKRLLDETAGEVITNIALRSPYLSKEDVSSAGFPQVGTLGALPDAQIWGPTGISASVRMLKHPGHADCGFYIANPTYYNKFYYSVAGSAVAMGGSTHTTTVGEHWDVRSVIKMTTSL